MSAVFDWLIKTHISLRLRDGSSLGALWELSGSSLGALWELVAVAGIGPYTLKGKDGTIIDFMALTMINSATSWFEVVELPLVRRLKTVTVNGKESSIVEKIFDKTSEHIAWLVNKTWLSRYPRCCCIIYNNGSEFKLNFEYLCVTYGIKRKPTTIKNPQGNAIFER